MWIIASLGTFHKLTKNGIVQQRVYMLFYPRFILLLLLRLIIFFVFPPSLQNECVSCHLIKTWCHLTICIEFSIDMAIITLKPQVCKVLQMQYLYMMPILVLCR